MGLSTYTIFVDLKELVPVEHSVGHSISEGGAENIEGESLVVLEANCKYYCTTCSA